MTVINSARWDRRTRGPLLMAMLFVLLAGIGAPSALAQSCRPTTQTTGDYVNDVVIMVDITRSMIGQT